MQKIMHDFLPPPLAGSGRKADQARPSVLAVSGHLDPAIIPAIRTSTMPPTPRILAAGS
jgi:hypothetical protein